MIPASSPAKQKGILGFAAVIAVIMFGGFARNFYLRAWLGTRVISPMVVVHGVVMSAWVLLFLTQSALVARREVGLHRRLGLAGAALAVIVVGLGIYTIAASIQRQFPQADAHLIINLFVAFDGITLLLFGGLVLTALFNRRRPEIHRRLMLLAMISLLPPALGRLVAYFTQHHVEVIVLGLLVASVLGCLLMDTSRHRRLHPAFVYGGALLIAAVGLTYMAQIAMP